MSLPVTNEDSMLQLDRLLHSCVDESRALKEILGEERAALEQQDSDALDAVAARKQRSVARLESLESERREICRRNGVSAEPDDMQTFVQSSGVEMELVDLWNEFIELARDCSELNVRNGAVINVRHRQIAGALSVIRGDHLATPTYSRNGRDTSSTTRRVLAEI